MTISSLMGPLMTMNQLMKSTDMLHTGGLSYGFGSD